MLDRSISTSRHVVLPPSSNFFSIEFSTLDYFGQEKNRYLYTLEGLSNDWMTLEEGAHKVAFNSLSPGIYTLRVKAANSAGLWSDEEATVRIEIRPPFWKTKMALLLYLIFLLAMLIAGRKLIQQREKMKFAVEHERQEIRRMRELDLMKIKFFTNVSHEFRTPLSLIMSPAEDLMKQSNDAAQRGQFELIYRNAKRLLSLVNQLLDFRKLEAQELKFNPSAGNIIVFIQETVPTFQTFLNGKISAWNFTAVFPTWKCCSTATSSNASCLTY